MSRTGGRSFQEWCREGCTRGVMAWLTGIAVVEIGMTISGPALLMGALWALILMAHVQVLAVLRWQREIEP